MLLPKSICVCKPCFMSVPSRVFMAKVPFLAFFFSRHEHRNGCGHIYMYLELFPDYIDSKYIWFHGLTP